MPPNHRKIATQPDISIIIPMRNECSYIGDTLSSFRSALDLSNLSNEIVVVDGASTDGSRQHCDLADIVVVEVELERSSIARARNIGALNSSGALLFHADADVRIPPGDCFFDRLRELFADPEVVAITGQVKPYPWLARPIDRIWHSIGNFIIRGSYRLHIYFARGEFQVVRSAVFNSAGGYNESIILGEDWDLFRRISKKGKVFYARELCAYHSNRRFITCGYSKTISIYIREFFSLTLFKRSHLKEWKEVR